MKHFKILKLICNSYKLEKKMNMKDVFKLLILKIYNYSSMKTKLFIPVTKYSNKTPLGKYILILNFL